MSEQTNPGNRVRKILIFILLGLFLLVILGICIRFDTETLIEDIGIRNGYLIAFFVSFFAGFSAFTAVSFYSILIVSITGGLNPALLGLITGISLALGDMFMFHFGKKGRDLLSGGVRKRIDNMTHYFLRKNYFRFIQPLAYIYISLLPLPNDWLLLFLASIRYPQRKMNLIIIAGDLTHAFLLSLLISKGILVIGSN